MMNFVSSYRSSRTVKNFLSKIFENYFHSPSCVAQFTQPTHQAHSHMLNSRETIPIAGSNVFDCRRQKFMEDICKYSEKKTASHLIAIPSACVLHMSEDIPYPFRQNTDFLYLSGFKEPNCLLLAQITSNSRIPECTLFVPKPTEHSVRWEGPKMDLQTTTDVLGVTRTLYVEDLEKYLHAFTQSHKDVLLWYDYAKPRPNHIHKVISDFMLTCSGRMSVESPRTVLHNLRLVKSDLEVELMRKTCRIGAESLAEVMKFSHPGIPEIHLQAKMDFECRLKGADFLAFPPVVAGADRANTIHYIENNNIVEDSDMVLMDSGCEYQGYTSDITRTWPVNGKYTNPQKEIYELVLSVQEELIELCKPGICIDSLFHAMLQKLGKRLQELSLIPRGISEEAVSKAAYEYCPHNVGHYLGMDVHDTNLVSRSISLQPGMIITIEPGVYIPKNRKGIPEQYKGLCVRIEDDVLITKNGCEVLTSACPKHIKEIEKLINK